VLRFDAEIEGGGWPQGFIVMWASESSKGHREDSEKGDWRDGNLPVCEEEGQKVDGMSQTGRVWVGGCGDGRWSETRGHR